MRGKTVLLSSTALTPRQQGEIGTRLTDVSRQSNTIEAHNLLSINLFRRQNARWNDIRWSHETKEMRLHWSTSSDDRRSSRLGAKTNGR